MRFALTLLQDMLEIQLISHFHSHQEASVMIHYEHTKEIEIRLIYDISQ